jgi:hypothetical protein
LLVRPNSETNPLWGAPRIHGELLKLGINVCQATVAKYMVGRRWPLDGKWLVTHAHSSVPFDVETGRASLDLKL